MNASSVNDDELEEETDPKTAQVLLNRVSLVGRSPYNSKDYEDTDTDSYQTESDRSDDEYKVGKQNARSRGAKRFKCDICSSKLISKSSLARHMMLHSEDGFSCEQCSKKFITRSRLSMHTRMKHGERRFVCEECGDGFVTAFHLSVHMVKHVDGLPYPCDQCDMAFKTELGLGNHEFWRHKPWTVECHFCGRGFVKRVQLSQHMARVHSRKRPLDEREGGVSRRSARDVERRDYRADVIDVVESVQRHRARGGRSAVMVVGSRLRKRAAANGHNPRRRHDNKGKRARPSGSRMSQRSGGKSVSYTQRGSSGESESDSTSEFEPVRAPRSQPAGRRQVAKRTDGRGRPAGASRRAAANGDDEHSEEESLPSKQERPKSARRSSTAVRGLDEDQGSESEEENLPLKRKRPSSSRASARVYKHRDEEEKASLSSRRSRGGSRRSTGVKYNDSEHDGSEEEVTQLGVRNRGRPLSVSKRSAKIKPAYVDGDGDAESSVTRGRPRTAGRSTISPEDTDASAEEMLDASDDDQERTPSVKDKPSAVDRDKTRGDISLSSTGKRGRPRKERSGVPEDSGDDGGENEKPESPVQGRGRPRKERSIVPEDSGDGGGENEKPETSARGRGRPRKERSIVSEDNGDSPEEDSEEEVYDPPDKRGRRGASRSTARQTVIKPPVAKRGRPRLSTSKVNYGEASGSDEEGSQPTRRGPPRARVSAALGPDEEDQQEPDAAEHQIPRGKLGRSATKSAAGEEKRSSVNGGGGDVEVTSDSETVPLTRQPTVVLKRADDDGDGDDEVSDADSEGRGRLEEANGKTGADASVFIGEVGGDGQSSKAIHQGNGRSVPLKKRRGVK